MMSPAQHLAVLIEEQADDDASPWADGHKREVQASAIESGTLPDLPDWLDSQPDPKADTVGEAIAREALGRWDASAGGEWMPTRAKETIGVGLIGWDLTVETATMVGRVCPCCGDRPGPGRVCLGCCRGDSKLDGFLERLRQLDRDLPEAWRSIETEPERAAVVAEHDRQEQSLAERRYAGREARRASQGPPRATPERPGKVRMADPSGSTRMVRAAMVETYRSSGWRVA